MYILGLNEALGSSAAILKDGEIIAAALEERFTRVKNCWGFPKKAINYCLEYAGITREMIDLVVLSYIDPYSHFVKMRAVERQELAPVILKQLRQYAPNIEYHLPPLNSLTQMGRSIYYKLYTPKLRLLQKKEISQELNIPQNRIISVDHHTIHASAAYYANPFWTAEPTLILTNDGAGDSLCATVTVVHNGTFKRIASTSHTHSLGLFYASITSYLGLKAHEDEYKVMGLASYVDKTNLDKLLTLFRKLVYVEGLVFQSNLPARQYGLFLNYHLSGFRFDHIAAAAQQHLTEQLVVWVNNSIRETSINNIVFGGGVFLNVKTNREILKQTKVKKVFFMPSPGDDSNAIGACLYGFHMRTKQTPHPLTNLYLGPEFSADDVDHALKKYPKLKVTRSKNITLTVAQLLAKSEIVARFTGRMEFGARALGNRSILADPRNRNIVETLNKMIKMRDFWMPFAPTILDDSAKKYLINSKIIPAPYMIMAFETTAVGKRDLAAAIHTYDKSARPQILRKMDNPPFYDLIKNFEKLTGVGALLNTSFNIHGEPIVCNPADALRVFAKTRLMFMQINDLLISKQ